MEENARKRLALVLTILAGIGYFFLCSTPVPKELVLEATWASSVAAAPPAPDSSLGDAALLPFRLGERYGYFAPERGVAFASTAAYGVALSPETFVAYDRFPESLEFRSPSGALRFSTKEPGYPFLKAGRRFILAPNQDAVTELDEAGQIRWHRDFAAIITAFDASPDLALFGLLDGSLVGLDASGRELLNFAPGGSRIPGVYGCAVSPDGKLVAAVTGLDRQRLVVLERRSTAYRVAYHRWLESDFRRPVAIAFTEDGRRLLFESPGGIGVYDPEDRKETSLPAFAPAALGLSLPERDLLVALEGGRDRAVVLATAAGKRLYSLGYAGAESYLTRSADSLFLGLRGTGGDVLLRLDLREE